MVTEVTCTHADGRLVVRLSGEWRLGAPRPEPEGLSELGSGGVRQVCFDASELQAWDSVLLAFLRDLERRCREAGVEVDRSGLPAGAVRMLELAESGPEHASGGAAPATGTLVRVGQWAYLRAARWLGFLAFLGQATISVGRLLTLRARFRRSDLLLFVQQAGAEALPIVTLVSLLVGLILAFVGALQLQQFGADIFIANLVGIAMVREMGAMMTGIIMAGRTGAAYAAQLGTMKVTEEVDALVTFGIPPIDFLVLPRMLALCLMMPLLCLYADILGILGGALVGSGVFGLSPRLYWQQTLSAVSLSDLLVGLSKASVYGFLVAITGCRRGLQTSGSAAAVGAATTSAVVTAIVAIIVADGLFAVLCDLLEI